MVVDDCFSGQQFCSSKRLADERGPRRTARPGKKWQEVHSSWNNHSLQVLKSISGHAKPWGGWATTAEDHVGCYSVHSITKAVRLEIRKRPGDVKHVLLKRPVCVYLSVNLHASGVWPQSRFFSSSTVKQQHHVTSPFWVALSVIRRHTSVLMMWSCEEVELWTPKAPKTFAEVFFFSFFPLQVYFNRSE